MGASVLSALGCLRGGTGKLTCYIPLCGYGILQTAVPESMCISAGDNYILTDFIRDNGITSQDLEIYDAIGIGPGIGQYPSHRKLLTDIFSQVKKPMVLDADALNTISRHKELLDIIPPFSILTPHIKEFERLTSPVKNDFERLHWALQLSKKYQIHIIVKGRYSFISSPDGRAFFNNTGNAGMATAGSGDVLTGIITAMLAQGYTPLDSCILGTYLHGVAGDIAAEQLSQEAMIASDIVKCLPPAFKQLTE